jgi:hypothetical protein
VVRIITGIDEKVMGRTDGRGEATYVVDATGLGAPVIVMLRREIEGARIKAAALL